MVLPVQDGKSPEADAAEPDHEDGIPDVLVPALSVSQSEDLADADAADGKMSLAAESMAVAPIAPSEIRIGAATNPAATAFNPWNLVFIGGLLLAGTMILAGTFKPESEVNTTPSSIADTLKSSEARHVGAPPASHRKWTESSGPLSVTVPVSQTAETLTEFEPAIQADSAVRVAKALVAGHEWFSGDWQEQIDSSELSSHDGAAAGDSVPASCGTDHLQVAIESSENAIVSAVESVKTLSCDAQSFSELEDLLQNRLQIELCETQLPLRVALFGKPAGPRCLRIDAAHATIPAPHMNRSPDKRREQTAAATNVAPEHSAVAHTLSGPDSSGSLDRALHLLQQRTDL